MPESESHWSRRSGKLVMTHLQLAKALGLPADTYFSHVQREINSGNLVVILCYEHSNTNETFT